MELFLAVAMQIAALYLTIYLMALGFAVMFGGTRWLGAVTGVFVTRPFAWIATSILAGCGWSLGNALTLIDRLAVLFLRFLLDPLARRTRWLLARVLFPRRR